MVFNGMGVGIECRERKEGQGKGKHLLLKEKQPSKLNGRHQKVLSYGEFHFFLSMLLDLLGKNDKNKEGFPSGKTLNRRK